MASSVVGALRVNLGLDSAQFSKGLKEATTSLGRVGNKMQGIGKSMTKNLTVPIAGAVAAVSASLGVMSKSLGEIGDQARLAGIGAEEFQKLAFAADTVGVSQEKLADILKDTNDKFGDFAATGGGPLKDFFENIAPKVGITADAFRDLNSADALQLYISSLEKAGVSQQDMTFYLEALASDATGLAPLFAKNGEELGRLTAKAEQFGVASEGTIASAKSFNESMSGLQKAVSSLGLALVESGIFEVLASVVTKASEWVASLKEINPDIVKFGAVFGVLAAAIGPVLIALGLMVTAVAAISAPVLAVVAGLAALTAGLVAFWPEIMAAKEAVIAFGVDALEYIKGLPAEIATAFKELPALMLEIGGDIMQGLKDGIKNKIGSVKDAITETAGGLVSSIKGKLGIQSPSRVFMEIGNFIMQGLGIGIVDGAAEVQNKTGKIMDSVKSDFKGMFKSVLSEGASFKDSLGNLLGSISSRLFNSGVDSLFSLIPGFANGTNSAPGGMALVGERGPELVNLPRGSQVRTAQDTQRILGGGGSGQMDVRVYVDQDGNWQAKVEQISGGVVRQATPGIASQGMSMAQKSFRNSKSGWSP